MVKIILKNGALLEKPKVIIDSNIVGSVSSGSPLTLELEIRKTQFTTTGHERNKPSNRNRSIEQSGRIYILHKFR